MSTLFFDKILLPFIGFTSFNILGSLDQLMQDVILILASIVIAVTNAGVWLLQSASVVRLSNLVDNGWENSIYYVNIAAVFFLLALALANALRLNLESYEIKKTLPALIGGLLLANFSLYLCKAVLDLADIIVYELISGTTTGNNLATALVSFIMGVDLTTLQSNADGALEKVLTDIVELFFAGMVSGTGPIIFILGLFVLFIPAVILFLLAIISLARVVILYILVVIAPLGVLAFFFPPTRTYGQKWLDGFIQWAFMAPIVFFMLRLVTFFQTDNGESIFVNGAGGVWEAYMTKWFTYLAGIAIMLAALVIPFSLGGLGSQIMKFWQGALTQHIPNALQLKEKAMTAAYSPLKVGKYNLNPLAGVLANANVRRMKVQKNLEQTSNAAQLGSALNWKPTKEGDIKLKKSLLRHYTKDADEPFKDELSSKLAEKIQDHPDLDAYKNGTLTDPEKYREIAGMNKELANRAQNQMHPGHADAVKFLNNNWDLYNKDFLATPEAKSFEKSDQAVNQSILGKYYTENSIAAHLSDNTKPLETKTGVDASKVEQNIQNDLKLHYKKAAPGTVPQNLTDLKSTFKTEFDAQTKKDAANLVGAHNNKIGTFDLQNLEKNLENGNKNRMVSKLKNLGFDDSYIKKVEALETDDSGNFIPSLNNLRMRQTFKKANDGKTKFNDNISGGTISNFSELQNHYTGTGATFDENDPEFINYKNLSNKRKQIETVQTKNKSGTTKNFNERSTEINTLRTNEEKIKHIADDFSDDEKDILFGTDSKLSEIMKDKKKSTQEKWDAFNASNKKNDYINEMYVLYS